MLDLDSPELKQFLFEHIQTHEELQILVWFHRHPDAVATHEDLARETGISPVLTSDTLERLRSSTLLCAADDSAPVAFRYNRDNASHETLLDVMTLYQKEQLGVIRLMTANAMERLRTSALRAFADAFRARKPN